ncbi:MAG: amidohydrolase family protein [Pseudomonadales bacterium]|nr:amidohydrolase family protein [Pseudomonadales bacterium]
MSQPFSVSIRHLATFAVCSLLCLPTLGAEDDLQLDLVIANGRVIDPETELDAIRHVGIVDGSIVAISTSPLSDQLSPTGELIDASGLVVAPGFIDMHTHGQSETSSYFMAHDGVTTTLELESGVYGVEEWLEARRGKRPIHFGASASHNTARIIALHEGQDARILASSLRRRHVEPNGDAIPYAGSMRESRYATLTPDRYELLRAEIQEDLNEGAIGIGLAHQYSPGVNEREVYDLFEFAAEQSGIIFTHVRSSEPLAMQEVIANSVLTSTPLHIVHVNSMALENIDLILNMISRAQANGFDISTEVYPYTAASTGLESALFDEGWQNDFGVSYDALQWVATGERLNAETFELYRAQGGPVIIHMMQEAWIDRALSEDFVIVASDGMPYAPGAHPRSAGTFSRVLGRYVRERGVLDLPSAIRKITLMPARRLEPYAPQMARKGRVQIGADADLTLFDPERIIDTATFEEGLSYSEGIEYVLVMGTPVIRNGETVEGEFPGQAITGSGLLP